MFWIINIKYNIESMNKQTTTFND